MPSNPEGVASDLGWMRRALRLAAKGRWTHPNPHVGAVVVRDGEVVGEGFHPRKGEPHAEAFAFAGAGDRAQGATLYVTLEPCSFTGGGRTPCVVRCLNAGVARVVGAMTDPDPRVGGEGFRQLREAGVEVTVGVGEGEARALNFAYIHQRVTGLPFVTHKAALTLDGKIAATGGDSRWVTGEAARRHVHRLRDRCDAVVVGVGTVLADDPSLTTRLPRGNGHDPLRVIIDSSLRTPPTAKVAGYGTIIITTPAAPTEQAEALQATGAEIVTVGADSAGRVDVVQAMRLLSDRGRYDVLLESGGRLAASLWAAGLVNRVLYFVAPKVIGGGVAPTPVDGDGLSERMADAARLGRLTVRRFGDDLALTGDVRGVDKA